MTDNNKYKKVRNIVWNFAHPHSKVKYIWDKHINYYINYSSGKTVIKECKQVTDYTCLVEIYSSIE
jgi:hypothetical protein